MSPKKIGKYHFDYAKIYNYLRKYLLDSKLLVFDVIIFVYLKCTQELNVNVLVKH